MVKLIKRYRHKKFKVSIKSWISFEKSSELLNLIKILG